MFNTVSKFIISQNAYDSMNGNGAVKVKLPIASHDAASDAWGIMMLPWHIMIFARTSTNWLTTVINGGAPFGGANIVLGLSIIKADANALVITITKFIDDLNQYGSSRSNGENLSSEHFKTDSKEETLRIRVIGSLSAVSIKKNGLKDYGNLPTLLKDELARYKTQLQKFDAEVQRDLAEEISQVYITADQTETELQELKNSLVMLMSEINSVSDLASQHPDEKYPIHLLALKDSISHLLPS
ncbi:hypothetical protein ACOI9X_15845 [Pseudomonas sp. P2757]|uniref:hypothetical protein n=1 Tax=unclassified Pseudomonas TaxID=196821 RepID=UPI003B5ACE54